MKSDNYSTLSDTTHGMTPSSGPDIIVIGASAGGIEALQHLIADLPVDLPASIFVVTHFPPTGKSSLPAILNRKSALFADFGVEGERIEQGRIYIAPADHHMLLEKNHVRIQRGPRENHTRPAIDPLFRSAAGVYGRRVIGIVLSGMLNDGTAGLIDIKRQGGIALVQDPADALFADMPHSAIKHAQVDHILPVAGLARLLVALIYNNPTDTDNAQVTNPNISTNNDATNNNVSANYKENRKEAEIDEIAAETVNIKMPAFKSEFNPLKSGANKSDGEPTIHPTFDTDLDHIPDRQLKNSLLDCDSMAHLQGERDTMPSIYSCPDCGGVLWQMNEQGFLRFRCHVGHSHSAESPMAQQSEALETSMWYAIRTLVDKAKLSWQMAERAREHGYATSYAHFVEQARTSEKHARVLRDMIESTDAVSNLTKNTESVSNFMLSVDAAPHTAKSSPETK